MIIVTRNGQDNFVKSTLMNAPKAYRNARMIANASTPKVITNVSVLVVGEVVDVARTSMNVICQTHAPNTRFAEPLE